MQKSALSKIFVLACCLSFSCTKNRETYTNLELWYKAPAYDWQSEALPIGNGHMGAMIYGTIGEEHIQFNEKTLWEGGPDQDGPYDYGIVPGSYNYLAKIQELLHDGKFCEAQEYAGKHFVGKEDKFGSHQAFSSILIEFQGHDSLEAENYKRKLDLNNAISEVSYEMNGVTFKREYYCSYPDNVLVIKLHSLQEKAINCNLRYRTPHKGHTTYSDSSTLYLHGKLTGNSRPFMSGLQLAGSDGYVRITDSTIQVENASEVVLYLAAATDYEAVYPHFKDALTPGDKIRATLSQANQRGEDRIRRDHLADYRELFDRVSLYLGPDTLAHLSTAERIIQYQLSGVDPYLESLIYQYGRYLLISSSRAGSLPANLQGVWNKYTNPPWGCDYHLNINLQMNYWPAEITNLSECFSPLHEYIELLAHSGEMTAREYYDVDGWVCHWASNPWAFTAPGWSVSWGLFPGGAAWLCQHLWEHYLFNLDTAYLREDAYPLIKEAVVFWTQHLSEDGKGNLVSSPSVSPENRFIRDEACTAHLSAGASMDQQLIYDLYTNFLDASEILFSDDSLREVVRQQRERLNPLRIGKYGQIQEWAEDLDRPEDKHRHVSHLFALHPANMTSPVYTPEYASAAKKTLEFRGDGGTGWSRAWKICFWARLHDGEHAYTMLQNQLNLVGGDNEVDYMNSGGSYMNLLDAHPPFQIDGNFGCTAGITEMLVQSHYGEIHLLPALPGAWPDGHITGIKARMGFELDMEWKDGKLLTTTIHSTMGQPLKLRYQEQVLDIQTVKGRSYVFDGTLR